MPVKSQFYEGPGASFNLDESETRDYFNSVRRSFFLSRLLLHLCFFVHDRKATLPFAMLTVQYHVSLSSPPARALSVCTAQVLGIQDPSVFIPPAGCTKRPTTIRTDQ